MGDRFVRDRVSIEKVFRWLKIQIPLHGFIQCPSHRDTRPSLKVYGGKNGWYCFSCNKGGGPVEFLQLYKGMSFFEAKRLLMKKFNLSSSLSCKDGNTYVIEHIKKPEREFSSIVEAWERSLSTLIWTLLRAFPSLYTYWWDSGIEVMDLAREEALKLNSTKPLESATNYLLNIMCKLAACMEHK